jgi:hypothetical protein
MVKGYSPYSDPLTNPFRQAQEFSGFFYSRQPMPDETVNALHKLSKMPSSK